MATQKRPLPATELAKAETERTLLHIFDDPYVLQAFENLIPGGGGGLSDYTKNWVLDFGGNGDFATVDEVQNSPDVVNGDIIWVFGTSFSASATPFTKSVTWMITAGATMTLPTTINAAVTAVILGTLYSAIGTITGNVTLYGPGRFYIVDFTIVGILYAYHVTFVNGYPGSIRTVTVGQVVLYNCVSLTGSTGGRSKFTINGTGTHDTGSEITNCNIGYVDQTGQSILTVYNSYVYSLTKSFAGTLNIINSGALVITISATGVTFNMDNTTVTATITLPASLTSSKIRNSRANTVTASAPVVLDAQLFISETAMTNVTFAAANLNIVAGSFV